MSSMTALEPNDLELHSLESTLGNVMENYSLSHAEKTFIFSCTGDSTRPSISSARNYLRHVRYLTYSSALASQQILHSRYHIESRPWDRLLYAFSDILQIYRRNNGGSINRTLQSLVTSEVFKIESSESKSLAAKQLIFSVIGVATLLYIPIASVSGFQINTQGAPCFSRSSVDHAIAARPVDELLRALGDVIPKARPPVTSRSNCQCSQSEIPPKFLISTLNVHTLKHLGGIKIQWVDAISAHLNFDPSIPALYLFRRPSFCKMHETDDSILSILTKDFYIETESPVSDFRMRDLTKEIILSYGLLFREDRSSRISYRRVESTNGSTGIGMSDPYLDKLCGNDLPTSWLLSLRLPLRETYNPHTDFPIFKMRLAAIQNYMSGIETNRITSMWHDRRDLRLWFTIWAVLVIGGIGIIQSFISIFLSAVQVGLAAKSYQLQLAPTGSSTVSTSILSEGNIMAVREEVE